MRVQMFFNKAVNFGRVQEFRAAVLMQLEMYNRERMVQKACSVFL